MIGVVDIGVGNIGSIYKLLDKLKVPYLSIETPSDIERVDKVLFPGVGSYGEAVTRLNKSGLKPALQAYLAEDKPYLGICLGMQLLARDGHEGGETSEGLGIVNGTVTKMTPAGGEPLPHIGWNNIDHDGEGLFEGVGADEDFYFVHSYYLQLDEAESSFTFDYGGAFTAYVQKGNIHGAQFHPEKSQSTGIKFMENFLKC